MRSFLAGIRPFGPFVLRLMIGALAIAFAMGKVFHSGGMADWNKEVVGWGFKPWVSQAAVWGSLGGGFLLVIGLFGRLAALAFFAVTALLLWKTKLHAGFSGGLDFPLLTLAGCASIILSGPGKPSVDAKLFRRFSDDG